MDAAGSPVEFAAIDKGGKPAVAAALSLIERMPFDTAAVRLLEDAFVRPKGMVIGISGPPGAGKSTLINSLIGEWRRHGTTVAVLAIDPSSKRTRGALLGDRIRMRAGPADDGVFIRSIAARGRLGGLADIAYPATILLRALYDRVIVESVGVGQSETDIANVSDTVVLCVQPGSGDSLQFMKAGILEIPDIAVVTKADFGAAATRALADLKGALSLAFRDANDFEPRCLSVSATTSAGLAELLALVDDHEEWLRAGRRRDAKRRLQALHWLKAGIAEHFGRRGLEAVSSFGPELRAERPFETAREILSSLQVVATKT